MRIHTQEREEEEEQEKDGNQSEVKKMVMVANTCDVARWMHSLGQELT